MANNSVGTNYSTPDLVAKVTGRSKYAEDFRVDGMLFCKLLTSPMPHARVTRLDASAALKMPGVKAILTADEMPGAATGATLGENVQATAQAERGLTNEPLYEGEPILAVAAVDELTAADAIEKIDIEFEALPFVVDPIESLRPNGPNARTQGNVWIRPPLTPPPAPPATPGAAAAPPAAPPQPKIAVWKWTEEDFDKAGPGQMPIGKFADTFVVGDVDAALKKADLVLDETFMTQSTGHQPLETRSAMAYWQNGKLYIHVSTQSTVQTIASIARWVGVPADQIVVISEYTGGGFGSKIPSSIFSAIPALLSKKANAPVMMRITREEEHFIGRARPGILARVKVGFRKDGRMTALDMYTVMDNGPYDAQGDSNTAGAIASLAYQPETMRFNGLAVLTNTPPKVSQRSPGGMQANGIMEPIISKAARKLGLDQVDVRRINAPAGKAPFGAPLANGKQTYVTSAFVKEALDKGRELFKWDEKKALYSGKRQGTKARGIGVAVSPFSAGSIGFDGLFIIKPDGRITFQSGIGNHGTHSLFDVHRVAADLLDVPWEQCDVVFGNTSKNLPWTCVSAGSQTAHAMTRAAHAAAKDAIQKLQEIAAKSLGGAPASYKVAGGRVSGAGGSLTLGQAAKKAIELGGKYDGHELPGDINAITKASAAALAGQGLMAVAKDNYPRDGQSRSTIVGFALVEVDIETGTVKVLDYTAIGDVGTVLNPRGLKGQIFGGSMLGLGHALTQRWAYDQQYGKALARRFHHNRPPTILDIPQHFDADAVNIADPETPTGVRGVGEPPVGAGYAAVMNAIADAVGDDIFRRSPVSADIILTSLENGGRWVHDSIRAHV
jgi:CO/xanthine dehydrogenase Mo-binding subunit